MWRKPGEMPLPCISPPLTEFAGEQKIRGQEVLPSYLPLAQELMNQIEDETAFKPDQTRVGQLEEFPPAHRW